MEYSLPIPLAYIEKLKQTQQNPKYHAEGNVYIHTQWVLDQFHQLKGNFHLTPEEEKILYWATILHDIGKPEVTTFEHGRWRARGHEQAGVPIARSILLTQPDITPLMRKKVLDIVRWHYFPLHFMRSGKSDHELAMLATRMDIRLLGIFAILDFYGRECEDRDTIRKMMDTFHELHVPKIQYEYWTHQSIADHYRTWDYDKKDAAWKALSMERADLLLSLVDAESRSPLKPRSGKITVVYGPCT